MTVSHAVVIESPTPAADAPRAAERARLQEALEHARHLLPAQPPIRVFVHHNTLHAFQHEPFDEAVQHAAARFGAEPYQSEEAFARHLATGRITLRDIAAVLAEEPLSEQPIVPGAPSVRALRALRLAHPLERVEGMALRWLIDERQALSRFHEAVPPEARARVLRSAERANGGAVSERAALSMLYARLAPHAPAMREADLGPRPRDRVLRATGVDVDAWIHPLLVRLCAAFVDQGMAYWSMPERERGLLGAFRSLYGRRIAPPDPWLRGLAEALRRDDGLDAHMTAIDALTAMRVPPDRWDEVIEATLRALPGWAGMVAHLEERPDRAPPSAPPARLADYLAVALLLEAHAIAHAERLHRRGEPLETPVATPAGADEALVYEAFLLAQLAGVGPSELSSPAHARAFLEEVQAFGSIERRRLWHLAYERQHRVGVLDALLAHARLGAPPRPAPRAQLVFCFDEREGSLRRHLEELDAGLETLGFAGFFGVPMAYRGLSDAQPAALCPVVMRPRHLVIEEAIEPLRGDAVAARRRALGAMRHASRVGSQTFVRGSALSATVGLGAVVPLIARCLFPRAADRVRHALEHAAAPGVATRLRFERADGDDAIDGDGYRRGFTVGEMADIVVGVLRTMGVEARLAPLVVVVGHGSSSLNNPHEAAYDCGACGGGRGGPNARVFAAMANHPDVRAALAAREIAIPEGTRFVGAFHNTCDDAIHYFDLDLVPATHADELARVVRDLDRARRLDAHERCRRFESIGTGVDPERALAHVEGRSVDLGEPRPELGHATNAVAVIGRRERTRGLFLDRRAFLISYDPTTDPDGAILGPLLAAAAPVGAGINLEYYFSSVDPVAYGAGSKLPHNLVGLVGVMDGHASDLRTGLPWQMVEIHEPVRMLTVVEAEPALLERVLRSSPAVAEVVQNRWIQLVAWSPSTGAMSYYGRDGFAPYVPSSETLPTVARSIDHYRGHRDHLPAARVEAALKGDAS